ncbi:hypothetical protein, partial [Pseudomonas sp. PDC86]|uniref:hypothetical protein n=1 Tax=Pseudomonas sp. PDC86 TaxID=1882759 RepID=UPI001C408CD0
VCLHQTPPAMACLLSELTGGDGRSMIADRFIENRHDADRTIGRYLSTLTVAHAFIPVSDDGKRTV